MRGIILVVAALLVGSPLVMAESQTVHDDEHSEGIIAPSLERHSLSPAHCSDGSVDVTSAVIETADGILTVTLNVLDFEQAAIKCSAAGDAQYHPHAGREYEVRLTRAPANPDAAYNGGFTSIASFSARESRVHSWSEDVTWTAVAYVGSGITSAVDFEIIDGALTWQIPLTGVGEYQNKETPYDLAGELVSRVIIRTESQGADARSLSGDAAANPFTDPFLGILAPLVDRLNQWLIGQDTAFLKIEDRMGIDTSFTL